MTSARLFFEQTLLPAFAARFAPSDLVLNIGAGDHAYREHFTCRLVTADKQPGCDQTFPAEQIPYANDVIDGVLMMGVFERLDDPMQAMRELRRIVRPGGHLLVSMLGLQFEWRKPCDRWRLSPGGASHVVRDFSIVARYDIGALAHFFELQKPDGASA